MTDRWLVHIFSSDDVVIPWRYNEIDSCWMCQILKNCLYFHLIRCLMYLLKILSFHRTNVKTLRLKKFQILFYFIFIYRRINVSAGIVHVIWLIGQEWPYVLKSKHSCFNSENNKHICNHSLPFSCIKENGTTLN